MDFISQWSGSHIDAAVGVIRNSQVTANELTVLRGISTGIISASKAVVVDNEKNITGFNKVVSASFRGNYSELQDRTTDPADNPIAGFRFFYYKNGELFTKNPDGLVSRVGGGKETKFDFSNVQSIVCAHNYGVKYPLVNIIGSDDFTLEGQIFYQDTNTVVVSFNTPKSGQVFIRTV